MLFSAELLVLFSFVQVFGYLGTLEKSQKFILKISVPEASARPKRGHRAARGQPGGCLARPSSWPRHLPSWVGPTPPGSLRCPYLFSHRGNVETEVAFPIYTAESPQPSVLPRRANLEAELASGEGEIIAIIIIIASPSPLHDFFSHVRV